MNTFLSFAACLLISGIRADVFFEENFSDDTWEERWIYSEYPGKEFGKFQLTAGKFYNDPEKDKGIQTSTDFRYYAVSTKFPPFSNKDKTIVLQFTVKHEQNIDCGGGYVKLFDCSLDPKQLHGDSPYLIMFGPDICGPGTKKVHAILNYKGKNVLINKDIRCKDDVFTHLYTFVLKPDNTYEVLIDNEKVESGELESDWELLPPKKIKDPNAKKPEDWDDRPQIDDVNDKKPEDWDKPELIPDENAKKPEDWDDEMDGEWDRPKIDNPEYKGEWKPRQIDNPNYKGVWVHPEIDNPEYVPDSELYLKNEACGIGFDLWQVKSGTIFSNILITDDVEYAKNIGETVWRPIFEGEKKMKEAQDEIESKEAAKDTKTDDDIDDEDEEDDEKPDADAEAEGHDEL